MENRPNRLINAALIAALAELQACNTIKPVHVEPSPTIAPPRETMTPFQPPTLTPEATATKVETATPVPTERTLESMFKLGTFNVGNTPFTLDTTPGLMSALGFTGPDINSYHADIPLPITVPGTGTQGQEAAFAAAAKDNGTGNPFYVILTDEPNQLFAYFHSLQVTAPGDLAREIGGVAFNHPDRLNNIYGQKVIITPKDSAPITAEVVFVSTFSADFLDNGDANGFPWGVSPYFSNPTVALTDLFKIPESIRGDRTPNTYYLTIIGCQNKNPGEISVTSPSMPWDQAYTLNTTNRSLLTLKFTLP